MPETKPLKPFGKATLEELVEESCRLRERAEKLRQRMTELGKVIHERKDAGDQPPRKANRCD